MTAWFAAAFEGTEQGRTAGLLHDLGKAERKYSPKVWGLDIAV